MRSRVGSFLLILVLLLPVGAVFGQDEVSAIPRDDKGLPLWEIAQWNDAPVRLILPDHEALNQLLAAVPIASFNREQIDVVYSDPKSYHLVFEPRVTPEEADRLAEAGYAFENIPDVDRAGREATEARWADLAEIGGKALLEWEKGTYPTFAEIGTQLTRLETDYPDLCRYFTWGQSVQGRDLHGIVISNNVDSSTAEPEVRLSGSIHGDEGVPLFLLMTLAHYLAENYDQPGYEQVTELLNTTEITIMPLHNPDGYIAHTRSNANGVDLNRNFDEPAGTHPARETENIQFVNHGLNNHFVISQNGHGGALVVNYPWDYTYTLAPDNDALRQMSLEYSTQNLPMYNSSAFPQGITNGAEWYVTTGCLQDWSYYITDCMDLTIEVSNDKWPDESTLDGFWDDNRQSLLDFVSCAHYGVNGVITGADSGLPLDATITVVGNAMPVHTDPAHGDYYKLLPSGTFDINYAADGYISQTITGISTTWGTPTVQDVVLQPVATGVVSGTVQDTGGNGLNAQVSFYTHPLGDYVTTVAASAALDGAYTANLVYGEYRVEAVASDFLTGVEIITVGASPVVQDFTLGQTQEVVLFTDDFEGSLAGWTGTWGITDPADGYNSANSMNDSPGDNYPDNATTTMEIANSLDLSGSLSGTVEFWAKWEIEDAWDGCFFEISTDGGGSWTPLATAYTTTSSGQGGQLPGGSPVFDNNQAGWVLNTVDLAPYLTETSARFRFRLSSDPSVHYSGFFVDDFEIMVVREQTTTAVEDLPMRTAAVGAWPNPFNPMTTVKFSVPTAGQVNLCVYDLQGRLVRTLAHGHFTDGDHVQVWDGTTDSGARASSGSYVVRLTTGSHQATTKLSLIK